MAASPFADLPAAIVALVPEAADAGAGEARSDCAHCPMAAETAPHPWSFAPERRCCTYQPVLPSFLAGRALARGGAAAAAIMARLADPDGVSALGIAPPSHMVTDRADFGSERAPRCPFWSGGDLACAIWFDRPATCRAWFCKHDDGLGGAVAWVQLARAVDLAFARVARHLVDTAPASAPPPSPSPLGPPVTPAAWADWYRACADRVAALGDDPARALATPALATPALADRRDDLIAIRRRPVRRLADHLVPAVTDLLRDGARVLLTGYSTFDAVVAPVAIFAFLARLDGTVRWQDALAEARATTAEPALDEPLVRELHRVGALRAADGADDLPFVVEPLQPTWTRPRPASAARDRE